MPRESGASSTPAIQIDGARGYWIARFRGR
jgi:hypothetical protein